MTPLLKKATILFDMVHDEMLNVHEKEFTELHDLLKRLNVRIKVNETSDITRSSLDDVDIFIIGNPVDNFFSNIEIKAIVDFVREGGGLLIISDYGADYLQKTNLNDLSGKYFGIFFEKNIIREVGVNNKNCSSVLSIQAFPKHKITSQVRDLIIGGACSMVLHSNSMPLLSSSDLAWTEIYKDSTHHWLKDEEDQKQVLAAYIEYGKGKVIAMGDLDIFTNNPSIGLNCLDNRKFILNLLNWLIEPIKESEVMGWTLDQIGVLQDGIKSINTKINNIIETMTILEKRISSIERTSSKGSRMKDLKKEHEENIKPENIYP